MLLAGISKGGFGAGLGALGVPLMALIMSPIQAAAVMLPVLCMMDLVGFRAYFGKWDKGNLRVMLPGAVVGIAAGAIGAGCFGDRWIRLVIGTLSICFVLVDACSLVKAVQPKSCSAKSGFVWSCMSGFASFVAHAGGPPAMIHLLPQRLDKDVMIGTTNAFFLIVNAIKLVPYAWMGQFQPANLRMSLLLAPLVPIGVWSGIWLQRHVSVRMFYLISQGCLFIAGVHLIVQALAAA
ncbi:sulfite exporter TauE/SafE family protein [Trinickia sp. LjRoot230]|uniref:sulfite exporter TauE/SafE family protein n=1 Tax=Trinickia sp. LjRoot230 TaxID=3342288 RepID=UPI003ECF6CF5